MSLAVCWTFDARSETILRALWRRLEAGGVPTLLSHTHGRHVPHLTLAALRDADPEAVAASLEQLPVAAPGPLVLDGLGAFRRSRCWLAPAVRPDLVARQEAVARAAASTGAVLHRHYEPGQWLPHLTLAPRLHLQDLPTVAATVFAVLPLVVEVERCELVETATGARRPLRRLV